MRRAWVVVCCLLPLVASQSPWMASRSSNMASQPPWMASQPPIMAFQPPWMASQPPIMAFQPPGMASQPPIMASQPPIELRFFKALDAEGGVLLRWDFNRSAELAVFELRAPTTGWLGFGLSTNGGMTGADIVIGGVFPNKTVYFADYHGISNSRPVLDGSQDYHLMSLTENENATVMRFCRQFRTLDPSDLDITDDTMRVIFAYGANDTIRYHMNRRGTKSIYLLQEHQPSLLPTPGISAEKELKISNFSIPAMETVYACTFAALPNVTKKHHIYKFEPIIQAGHEALVHHIVLYACPRTANVTARTGECQERKDSDPFTQCFQNLVAWAVGGEAFQFPGDVGISVGTPDDPTHVMMEIHYSNFQAISGLRDNSGMRLYYTQEVRKHDVGILEVGPTLHASLFIPPRLKSFKAYGLCKTEQFKTLSPDVEEMQVFASLLHTHLTGRAVQIAHFRDGAQIGFLGRDMNYDFNLQETRLFRDVATLRVGDEIVVECTYNTMDRSNLTYGGTGTKNEMCMGFLYIYPRSNVTNCMSHPDVVSIANSLGRNVSSMGEALMVIRSFKWDNASSRMIEEMSRDTKHMVYVLSQSGNLTIDSGYVRNITEPARGHSADQPDHVTPDHGMPDLGNPEGHLPNVGSGGSRASQASGLPLLILFFHAGLACLPGFVHS